VNTPFRLEFIEGKKEYDSGRDALIGALSLGFLHLGDRGSVAVSLFYDVHKTDHYADSQDVREDANPQALQAIAEALVREVRENGWEDHEFSRMLRARDPSLINQLNGYGVHI